jgi:hypothetical protein
MRAMNEVIILANEGFGVSSWHGRPAHVFSEKEHGRGARATGFSPFLFPICSDSVPQFSLSLPICSRFVPKMYRNVTPAK